MNVKSATSLHSIKYSKANLSKFLKTLETVPSQILAEEAETIQREARQENLD